MTRFHSGRNDRSWHGDHRRTSAALKRHTAVMQQLIAEGMDKEAASREAFRRVTAKPGK
jgi:hypothetical protein